MRRVNSCWVVFLWQTFSCKNVGFIIWFTQFTSQHLRGYWYIQRPLSLSSHYPPTQISKHWFLLFLYELCWWNLLFIEQPYSLFYPHYSLHDILIGVKYLNSIQNIACAGIWVPFLAGVLTLWPMGNSVTELYSSIISLKIKTDSGDRSTFEFELLIMSTWFQYRLWSQVAACVCHTVKNNKICQLCL